MPISLGKYLKLKERLLDSNYADEVDWAENIQPCTSYHRFAEEFIWVVLNSGMRAQVALTIWKRLVAAIQEKQPLITAFGHKGKVGAMERMLSQEGVEWFEEYQALPTDAEKIQFLESLPHIGSTTKWHLAKTLGVDCMKPDRHLVRLGGGQKTEAMLMCKELAKQTGDRIATVDAVLWRAANLGWV
jgi:hypothetical protein